MIATGAGSGGKHGCGFVGKNFDELYGYDLIDRLKSMARGDLNANKDAVTSKQFAQDWSLDAVGNWRNFREDTDGSGWNLDQQRTPNKVNEIIDIAETLGASWVTPAYDRAGNMTTIPKPADPTVSSRRRTTRGTGWSKSRRASARSRSTPMTVPNIAQSRRPTSVARSTKRVTSITPSRPSGR